MAKKKCCEVKGNSKKGVDRALRSEPTQPQPFSSHSVIVVVVFLPSGTFVLLFCTHYFGKEMLDQKFCTKTHNFNKLFL